MVNNEESVISTQSNPIYFNTDKYNRSFQNPFNDVDKLSTFTKELQGGAAQTKSINCTSLIIGK